MLNNLFGSYTDKNKKTFKKMVNDIEPFYNKYKGLTDSKERVKVKIDNEYVAMTREELSFLRETNKFRKRLNSGEDISKVSIEALALCKEAIRRKYNNSVQIELYPTQLEAAIAMQDNNIIEMKTGEGKSLVQIASAYLNALIATSDPDKSKWKSVHVLTSNDYLAQRDQSDNKDVFSLLGFTSSYVLPNSESKTDELKNDKRKAYKCDIVYATPKTVAFDYLADNTVYDKNKKYLTREISRAIIDEADDILLDAATTPLILSGKSIEVTGEENPYIWATNFINGNNVYKKTISSSIFDKYEKDKHTPWMDSAIYKDTLDVDISDRIYKEVEKSSTDESIIYERMEALRKCLLAKYLYSNGKEYQVINNKVVLIDSNTGRLMPNTRFRDGMQEAIEYNEEFILQQRTGGMEHIELSKNNFIEAKCTYPDFLKIYSLGVCGMTGTADKEEFRDIYGLDTYIVDSRKTNKRIDLKDELYSTIDSKLNAIVEEVLKCKKTGQPVLLGTLNVKESDLLCDKLLKAGISYKRLDAISIKNKDEEEMLKKYAGSKGSVTVATNMAGRGIDIKLGEGVEELGGLYVIGTSKNKNIRIDNQLRGRSARQGDLGRSKYFMSLEDEMIAKRLPANIRNVVSLDDGRIVDESIIMLANKCQMIESSIIKQSRKVSEEREAKVFTPYKEIIYSQRDKILNADGRSLLKYISDIIDIYIKKTVVSGESYNTVKSKLGHLIKINECFDENTNVFMNNVSSKIRKNIYTAVNRDNIGEYLEETRYKMLRCIDDYWVSYIDQIEMLNKNINLYQYGSGFNNNTYEEKAAIIFSDLMDKLQNEIITYASKPIYKYGTYIINNEEEVNYEKSI